MEIKDFKIGEVYTRDNIIEAFGGSMMRGMDFSKSKQILKLISKHLINAKGNPYEDRWYQGKLHYTGEGQKGDQSFKFMNKKLLESLESGIKVYLFEVYKEKEYLFSGEVKLLDPPYFIEEKDSENNRRKVIKFPLTLVDKNYINHTEIADDINNEKWTNTVKISNKAVEKLARQASQRNQELYSHTGGINEAYRELLIKNYERNANISYYVKRIAHGICALCKLPAPFISKDGEPFLHAHHIEYLSRGGKDILENCVAVCPNCHAKIHNLEQEEDVLKLQQAVIDRLTDEKNINGEV